RELRSRSRPNAPQTVTPTPTRSARARIAKGSIVPGSSMQISIRSNPNSFMRSTRSRVLLENGETQMNVLAPYRIAQFLPYIWVGWHGANQRRDQERPPILSRKTLRYQGTTAWGPVAEVVGRG